MNKSFSFSCKVLSFSWYKIRKIQKVTSLIFTFQTSIGVPFGLYGAHDFGVPRSSVRGGDDLRRRSAQDRLALGVRVDGENAFRAFVIDDVFSYHPAVGVRTP